MREAPPAAVPARLLTWPLVLGLLMFTLAMSASQIFWDPDTYWHIASGTWMLDHHAIPTRDVFSHSMAGTPWTVHEWGSQILITSVYRWFGWGGLQVLVATAYACTITYAAQFLSRRLEPVHVISATSLVAVLLWTHFLVRPHVLAWPLLAVWVGTLFDAAEARRAPPWLLLGLVIAWANLHLSYTLGLAIAAGIATDAVWQEPSRPARLMRARQWGVFLAASVACLMLNPHGWHALQYTVDVMGMKSLAMVSEWRSADFHEFQLVTLWIVIVIGLALGGWLRLSWPRIVLILVMFYLALKHQRYHSLLGLVSIFVLAAPFAAQWYARPVQVQHTAEGLDRVFAALVGRVRWQGILAVLAMAVSVAWARVRFDPPQPPKGNTPAAALSAFSALHITGNVFNSYIFGGYLIFRGVPVMIDGRSDMYGDAVMAEVSDAVQLKKSGALDSVLVKYHIAWTMLTPSTPGAQLMDRLPEWKRIFADSVAVVHVRRDRLGAQGS